MTDEQALVEVFESHRPRLRAVAQRMLGSGGGADDAVQETWLRLARSDVGDVENLAGWLTTVVSRICLDQLRRRAAQHEVPASERPDTVDRRSGPEEVVELTDSLGVALTVVLETLSPNERVAFVLHDLFDVPFADVAALLETSDAAARQYASRGRRRARGAAPNGPETVGSGARRDVVAAFLSAAREGEFDTLLKLLAPEVTLRADATVVAMGGVATLEGPRAVAEMFNGKAKAARMALLDGLPGAAWWQGGVLRVVFVMHVEGGLVTGVEQLGDPERLAQMVVEPL